MKKNKRPRGRNDVDIEFETKAFQVCDKDGDGALDWQEVENCEVNKWHFLKNGLGNTKRNIKSKFRLHCTVKILI